MTSSVDESIQSFSNFGMKIDKMAKIMVFYQMLGFFSPCWAKNPGMFSYCRMWVANNL